MTHPTVSTPVLITSANPRLRTYHRTFRRDKSTCIRTSNYSFVKCKMHIIRLSNRCVLRLRSFGYLRPYYGERIHFWNSGPCKFWFTPWASAELMKPSPHYPADLRTSGEWLAMPRFSGLRCALTPPGCAREATRSTLEGLSWLCDAGVLISFATEGFISPSAPWITLGVNLSMQYTRGRRHGPL